MPFSRKTVINVFLLLAMAVLVLSIVAAYVQIQRWYQSNQMVMHTHEVIERADSSLLAILRSELLMRDYFLTQDRSRLTELPTEINQMTYDLQQLAILTRDNPRQQWNIRELDPVFFAEVNLLKSLVNANINPSQHMQLFNEAHSQKQLEKIFLAMDRIKQEELRLLQGRTAFFNIDAKRSTMALITTGSLGFIFILLSFGLINYHLRELAKVGREKIQLENRLKTIIDSSNELIVSIDENFKFLAFNLAYEKFFEKFFKKKIETGMSLKVALANTKKGEEILKTWQRALSGEAFTEVIELSHDASKSFYEASYTLIRDVNGRLIGAAHIMRDITERKKIDDIKNEFIAVVSHELRTPLTSIKGSISLLLSGAMGKVEDKMLQMLTIAYENCERLIRLINDILDVHKIEAGDFELQKNKLELHQIVETAIKTNQHYAERFKVKLTLTEPVPNIVISGDREKLLQVMSHVLSNAIKFSNQQSEVNITLTKINKVARITITDYGLGIPEHFQKQIFQKFTQADSSARRQHGGSGLGLNISKAVIEKHGGDISFTSTEGKGTSFYIDLPILAEKIPDAIQNEETKHPRSILYIEDDADLSKVVTNMLASFASVVSASDKNRAYELLKTRKFDLILLDLSLPDGSGLDLLPQLLPLHIPIVVYSAHELAKQYRNDVAYVLIKSKTTNEMLINTVKKAMDNKLNPVTI